MNNPYKFNQYQQNQVNTASPEQILLMLYDGAIRFTREAISGVEDNRPELRIHGVSKAMAIITEFSNTLNHDIGGKVAEDLHELYDYMIRELTSANINNDAAKLKVVETLLVDLRQTWGEAVVLNKQENAAAVATAAAAVKPKSAKTVDTPYQDTYTPFAVSS